MSSFGAMALGEECQQGPTSLGMSDAARNPRRSCNQVQHYRNATKANVAERMHSEFRSQVTRVRDPSRISNVRAPEPQSGDMQIR